MLISGHLIMQEIGKFDQKTNVISSSMKTCMAFLLVLIESMQFMNSVFKKKLLKDLKTFAENN